VYILEKSYKSKLIIFSFGKKYEKDNNGLKKILQDTIVEMYYKIQSIKLNIYFFLSIKNVYILEKSCKMKFKFFGLDIVWKDNNS
jgi:hypothetical protein